MPLLMAIQLQWLFRFQNAKGLEHFSFAPGVALGHLSSFLTLGLLLYMLGSATARWPRLRLLLTLAVLGLAYCAGAYAYRAKSPLDFAVLADNAGEGLSLDGFKLIFESIGWREVWTTLGMLMTMALLHLTRQILLIPRQPAPGRWALPASLAAYVLAVILPFNSPDGLLYLIKSAWRYGMGDSPYRISEAEAAMPPVRVFDSANSPLGPDERKPDIILIMVESFNASVIEARSPGGVELTPGLNAAIARGLYVDRFYGNSVQTVKGQVAALCGVLPSLRGKIMKLYPDLRLRCLPEILGEAGYRTLFFQGYKNLDFDNTGPFMRSHGIQEAETAHNWLTGAEKAEQQGWGMRDRMLYSAFWNYLESLPDERPIFATLATIYSHTPFESTKPEDRAVYRDPSSKREHYANAIHEVDADLMAFLSGLRGHARFKNALVIVTGDHSYPLGDHGIDQNEAGYYDESFRTPLLVLWPGRLAPRRISDRVHSQLDMAPTVMDLIGLQGIRHRFTGNSMLDTNAPPHPAYLVQPYTGRYLAVVDGDWKYLYHESEDREFLYDLAADPQESADRWDSCNEACRNRWRSLRREFYVNQKRIERNAFWPK